MLKAFKLITLSLSILFSCSEDKPDEEIILMNVTNEVVLFRFTSDTGDNSSRLQYEICFDNPNNIAIQGFTRLY